MAKLCPGNRKVVSFCLAIMPVGLVMPVWRSTHRPPTASWVGGVEMATRSTAPMVTMESCSMGLPTIRAKLARHSVWDRAQIGFIRLFMKTVSKPVEHLDGAPNYLENFILQN